MLTLDASEDLLVSSVASEQAMLDLLLSGAGAPSSVGASEDRRRSAELLLLEEASCFTSESKSETRAAGTHDEEDLGTLGTLSIVPAFKETLLYTLLLLEETGNED